MDLRPSHVPRIIAGLLLGSGAGYLVSLLLPAGMFGPGGQILGLRVIGMLFGGIAGAGISVVVLVYKDSHRPETGVASNFSSINGMGSSFIGRSDLLEDGSYLTTEWFTVLWIPVFPVCTYRLIKVEEASSLFTQTFVIKEKHPVRLSDLGRGYARTLAIALLIALAAWFLRK